MAVFNFGPWETKGLPILDESLPADASVTATNSATFKVSIAKDGKPKEYTYQWYENGKAVSGATSDTYVRSTTKNDGGQYLIYCTVTNKAGTVTSRTATLSVDASAYSAPTFTYNGRYSLKDDSGNTIQPGATVDNWILTLLTGGTLKVSDMGNAVNGVDVFLVGGGGGGATNYGAGGGGGYTRTVKNHTLQKNVSVTIGGGGAPADNSKAGDGGITRFGSLSVNGGSGASCSSSLSRSYGGNGGSGGGGCFGSSGADGGDGTGDSSGTSHGGTGQHATTREFGNYNGKLYASGGKPEMKDYYGGYFSGGNNTGNGGDQGNRGGSGIVIVRNKR